MIKHACRFREHDNTKDPKWQSSDVAIRIELPAACQRHRCTHIYKLDLKRLAYYPHESYEMPIYIRDNFLEVPL
jgi:hypothetical protein